MAWDGTKLGLPSLENAQTSVGMSSRKQYCDLAYVLAPHKMLAREKTLHYPSGWLGWLGKQYDN